MGLCGCFKKEDELDDLAAPLEPAIPKPGGSAASAQQRNAGAKAGKQGGSRLGNGNNAARDNESLAATPVGPGVGGRMGATPPQDSYFAEQQRQLQQQQQQQQQQQPYSQQQQSRMEPTSQGNRQGAGTWGGGAGADEDEEEDQEAEAHDPGYGAGGRGGRAGYQQGKPPAIQVPHSPPAQPKEANWGVTPMDEQGEADVDDVQVDMEEVQELSPVPSNMTTPTASVTSPHHPAHVVNRASTPRSPGSFRHSPSNLGPGRKQQAAAMGRASSLGPSAESGDDREGRRSGFGAQQQWDSPQISPGAMEQLHGNQQRSGQYATYAQQRLQHSAHGTEDDEDGHSHSQSSRHEMRRRGTDGEGRLDRPDDSEEDEDDPFAQRDPTTARQGAGPAGVAGRAQRSRAGGSPDDADDESGGGVTDKDDDEAGQDGRPRSASGQKGGYSPTRRSQGGSSARRTAAGSSFAPARPSPLGASVRKSQGGPGGRLDRRNSNTSDLSDPGEYERYGGGSSEEEEMADREYEQAIVAAGGHVVPGATRTESRRSAGHLGATNSVPDGSAAAAAASMAAAAMAAEGDAPAKLPSPLAQGAVGAAGAGGARLGVGYENPMWTEPHEDDDDGSALPKADVPLPYRPSASSRGPSYDQHPIDDRLSNGSGPQQQQGLLPARSSALTDSYEEEGTAAAYGYSRGQPPPQRPPPYGGSAAAAGSGRVSGAGTGAAAAGGGTLSVSGSGVGLSSAPSRNRLAGGRSGSLGGDAPAGARGSEAGEDSVGDAERWGSGGGGQQDESDEDGTPKPREPMQWAGVWDGPAGAQGAAAPGVPEHNIHMTTLSQAAASAKRLSAQLVDEEEDERTSAASGRGAGSAFGTGAGSALDGAAGSAFARSAGAAFGAAAGRQSDAGAGRQSGAGGGEAGEHEGSSNWDDEEDKRRSEVGSERTSTQRRSTSGAGGASTGAALAAAGAAALEDAEADARAVIGSASARGFGAAGVVDGRLSGGERKLPAASAAFPDPATATGLGEVLGGVSDRISDAGASARGLAAAASQELEDASAYVDKRTSAATAGATAAVAAAAAGGVAAARAAATPAATPPSAPKAPAGSERSVTKASPIPGLPRYMQPTVAAAAHRRPSEDGIPSQAAGEAGSTAAAPAAAPGAFSSLPRASTERRPATPTSAAKATTSGVLTRVGSHAGHGSASTPGTGTPAARASTPTSARSGTAASGTTPGSRLPAAAGAAAGGGMSRSVQSASGTSTPNSGRGPGSAGRPSTPGSASTRLGGAAAAAAPAKPSPAAAARAFTATAGKPTPTPPAKPPASKATPPAAGSAVAAAAGSKAATPTAKASPAAAGAAAGRKEPLAATKDTTPMRDEGRAPTTTAPAATPKTAAKPTVITGSAGAASNVDTAASTPPSAPPSEAARVSMTGSMTDVTPSSTLPTTPNAVTTPSAATPPPERTSSGAAAAGATPGPAAAGGGGAGGLPFGEWRMVRLKKEMKCCAAEGTVAQETHDGELEVFQCEETLQPGSLAAVISHEVYPEGGGPARPKTWCFCPDPLCMESRPIGSDLPKWPAKVILAGGVKVTRAEYENLKGLGLDVTLPPKQPAAAAAAAAASG